MRSRGGVNLPPAVLFGSDLEFDLPPAIRFRMLHPKLKIAQFRDNRVHLHRNGLSRRNVLHHGQIDFEKADFKQLTFGVG